MGHNLVEYRASRWRAAAVLCLLAAIIYFGLRTFASPELATRSFEGEGIILNFASLPVRQGFFLVATLFMLGGIPMVGRFVLSPRAVSIGDDGIEVASVFGWRRALWADCKRVTSGAHGLDYISFRKGLGGKARTLILPSRLIGIDHDVILADVNLRLEKWRQLRGDRFRAEKAIVRAAANFRDAGGAAGRRRQV